MVKIEEMQTFTSFKEESLRDPKVKEEYEKLEPGIWCFAIVNNRLAEIFFDTKKGRSEIYGHCYVNRE